VAVGQKAFDQDATVDTDYAKIFAIEAGDMMQGKTITLTYPWDINGYKPYTEFHLSVDDVGFCMHIVVQETEPRRLCTEHQQYVHYDSCVEWFANFLPESCDRYFNFEVNAIGTMYAAFRKNRADFQLLTMEDVRMMHIAVEVHEDRWEVRYIVPFALIRKYIPDYEYQPGRMIRTNFYKCGDETKFPHYGIWKPYDQVQPEFHAPELFGEMVI
jgi:hypothetical protein